MIALLHGLRPDVDALARVTSEYAVGPYGFLMTSAFLALSVALAVLGMGLTRALSTPARSAPGIVLLFLAAIAIVAAAFFPVDVGAVRPITAEGRVHRIAAILAFASMTLAPILLARQFGRHPHWRKLGRIGGVVGVTGLLGFVAIQLVLLERGLAGAAQRVILALVIVWMSAVALRLTSTEVTP